MKRLVLLAVLLPICGHAELSRQYGEATTVPVCLRDYDIPANFADLSAITFVAGDVKVAKDGAAEANIAGSVTEREGCWIEIPLTTTEMQAAQITLSIADSVTKLWADVGVLIETYGNVSAQHEEIPGNVLTIEGVDATEALESAAPVFLASGTCDSGSATTCVDAALTQGNDYWNGAELILTAGSAANQSRCIADFVASSDTVYVAPAFTAAVSTDAYVIVANAACRR